MERTRSLFFARTPHPPRFTATHPRSAPNTTLDFSNTGKPLYFYFQGVPGMGQRAAAEALAREVNCALLLVNLAQILDSKTSFKQQLQRLQREALFQNAVLYLEDIDNLSQEDYSLLCSQLFTDLSPTNPIVILAGVQPWRLSVKTAHLISVPFTSLDFADRYAYWQTKLAVANITTHAKSAKSTG